MAVAIAAVLYANQRRSSCCSAANRWWPSSRRGSWMSACPNDLELLRRYDRCSASPAGRCSVPPGSRATCGLLAVAVPGPARAPAAGRGRRDHPGEHRRAGCQRARGPPTTCASCRNRWTSRSYRAWRQSTDRPSFSAIGRWARVGMASRLLDAGFDISLSLRGVVPGGTVGRGRAAVLGHARRASGLQLHGRVVREGGYLACHYLFFYVMNDFRSTFFGVNDHEADWEQVIVVPRPSRRPGRPREPTLSWVACAAHDVPGRRPAPPGRRPAAAAGRRHAIRW